jgi:hypothetical protein
MNIEWIDNIELDGIDHGDCPDYCDVYISSADYNGTPMTVEQLDEINENRDFVYDCIWYYILT